MRKLAHFIYLLGLLTAVISVHEAGHYLAAVCCGVTVEQFSVGIGLSLWSAGLPDGAVFHFRAVPFGGFVELLSAGPGSIEQVGYWPHMLIVVSGMFASLSVAMVYFMVAGNKRMDEPLSKTFIGRMPKPIRRVAFAAASSFGLWLFVPLLMLLLLVKGRFGTLGSMVSGPIGFLLSREEQAPICQPKEIHGPISEFAMLGVGLSVVNILPFPPLDGGVLMVLTATELFGSGLFTKFLTIFGMVLCAAMIFGIFANDIYRLFKQKKVE